MPNWNRPLLAVAAACLAYGLLPAADCNAGPIYDWWMQRQAQYAPAAPVAYQAAGVYGQTACTSCAPTACNSCATTACDSCNTGACGTVVAGYAPAGGYQPTTRFRGFGPRFRSVWARVPVTSYRPVMATDPTTGLTVASLQPCTTYTWQLRRVPVSTMRPMYAAATPTAYAATSGVVMAQPASSCSSFASGAATSAVPYSAAPVAPSYASPQPTVAPVPAAPGPVGPAETAPADQPPSLGPDGLNPGAALRVPSSMPSSVSRPAPSQPKSIPEIAPGITPIPDPDAAVEDSSDDGAPLLVNPNPRDRTAQFPVRRAWAFTPVSWPQQAAPIHAPPRVEPPQPKQPQWDASGWHSVNK